MTYKVFGGTLSLTQSTPLNLGTLWRYINQFLTFNIKAVKY